MQIGFIGTGSMGKPMAQNLLEAGHELVIYNRTPSKASSLEESGAHLAETPAEVAEDAAVVVTMVSDDGAMTDVVFGSEDGDVALGTGLVETLSDEAIHLAMSTISPETSRTLRTAHADRNQRYVAAPVFGKPSFAEDATLSVVAGGPENSVETCLPIFKAVGRQHFVVGSDPAKANIVKLAGNFTIASMMETLGESFALMEKAGIEPEDFLNVINQSLFDSPLYEAYGRTIAERDFEPAGFQLELGLKDMRLTGEVAQEHEAPMPLLSLLHDNLLSAVANGRGSEDWSALGGFVAERAGLDGGASPTA